jgi:hypothetical protein
MIAFDVASDDGVTRVEVSPDEALRLARHLCTELYRYSLIGPWIIEGEGQG